MTSICSVYVINKITSFLAAKIDENCEFAQLYEEVHRSLSTAGVA